MSIESATEFVRLRKSSRPEEYRRAAAESAPLNVWKEIIERFPEMRFWVAQNKSVPIDILRILAGDADVRVRSMVASKRKADMEILRLLGGDEDGAVRLAVPRNPNTPQAVLEELRGDPWDSVREVVRQRLPVMARYYVIVRGLVADY